MLLANDVESILKSGIKRKRRTTRNNRNIRNTTVAPEKTGIIAITMKSKTFQPVLKNSHGRFPKEIILSASSATKTQMTMSSKPSLSSYGTLSLAMLTAAMCGENT